MKQLNNRRPSILLAGVVMTTNCFWLPAGAQTPDRSKSEPKINTSKRESDKSMWGESPATSHATLARQATKMMEVLGQSKNKDTFEWYHLMAYCSFILGKHKDALRYSESALTKEKPKLIPCLNHLALIKAASETELGKYADAVKTYDEVLARKAVFARRKVRSEEPQEWFEGAILKRKGSVYQRMGNHREALRCYDHAFELETGSTSRILQQKPFSEREKKDAKGVVDSMKQAKLDASEKLNLAKAHIVLGNYDKAKTLLKEASTDPYAKYMVDYASARLEARLKRYESACDEFRKVFHYDPMTDHKTAYQAFPAGCAESTIKEIKREKPLAPQT